MPAWRRVSSPVSSTLDTTGPCGPRRGTTAAVALPYRAILGCHSVAVLPEGMSRERFDWLEEWVG